MERFVSIVDMKGDVPHSVAMLTKMLRKKPAVRDGGTQHNLSLTLFKRVARNVAAPRLEAGICELSESETVPVIEGRLLRVADPKLHVMNASDFQRIGGSHD